MFRNAVDICNRGLQHCGVSRIDPEEGFGEDSPRADACAFVYDKLRRSELEKSVWSFAVRRADEECARGLSRWSSSGLSRTAATNISTSTRLWPILNVSSRTPKKLRL